MRFAAALFSLAAAAIVAVWAWLGGGVEMPQSPLAQGQKLFCISYAPFRGAQDPFGPDIPIDPRQIDEDLAQLKPLTGCIRTYSTDHGLDQIPAIARRHGLKVMQGLWLSSLPDLSRKQVETAIDLANRYPDVIQSVVVGNEVLLRGEMSAGALAETIRRVKTRVQAPVTYADVWEFWLRYRDIASAVDFITIHILPYWEDIPVPAREAALHVDVIRKQVIAAFPGKDILLGEFGWPSAGRMREGALPSPANQAHVLHDVLWQAKRENYAVNVIEAYDQPWKRQLEGTVGGHWGLFDAYQRKPKFVFGAAVSNHPHWRWQAAGGVALAAVIFAGALAACWRYPAPPTHVWFVVAANALVSGTLIGWTVANVPIESLTIGDWLRSCAFAAIAVVAPVLAVGAKTSATAVASFSSVLGRRTDRVGESLAIALGLTLILLVLLAVQSALGLVFDPRYRDFPFAPLTGAAIPFLLLKPSWPRRKDWHLSAETIAAGTLVLCAIYILFNETLANWQAIWFCGALFALAVSLLPARDAPD